MGKVISIGKQSYASLRENNYFFIDKTKFIREWWESGDEITLITRPRRFGKTLNMNMLDCFFSNRYADRGDLFEGLFIWENEEYRRIQGTYPVIFLSFADVKQTNYSDAVQKIKRIIFMACQDFVRILGGQHEMRQLEDIKPEMDDVTAQDSLKNLAKVLSECYGKKTIILLDEYDTPMQEAWIHGYWKELTAFVRGLFNSTFKTNPYLERAVLTGITRVSKESVFSDLNNLRVVTVASGEYADCFGFTQEEVTESLEMFGLGEMQDEVREWYDGFTIGMHHDIYNPWSITNYLKERKFRSYWASTSSNGLVGKLLQGGSVEMKRQMEKLMDGGMIRVSFDEQIVYDQLETDENSVWSLLMASGYVSAEEVDDSAREQEQDYLLRLTNRETRNMFASMFKRWFRVSGGSYNEFMAAFRSGELEAMNYYMNKLTVATFSFFDVGGEPEKFYHGFVLGLMSECGREYDIRSNRESGFGRYDIMMIPKDPQWDIPAYVLEFKVKSRMGGETLEEALDAALRQIKEKRYDEELLSRGIPQAKIRHYGFAFEGKNVLIGTDS